MVRKKPKWDLFLWVVFAVVGGMGGSFATAVILSINAQSTEVNYRDRIQQVTNQLRETQQTAILLKRQLAIKAKPDTSTDSTRVIELKQQLSKAIDENNSLNQQLLNIQEKTYEPPQEPITAKLANNLIDIVKAVAPADGRPTIKRAAAINGINFNARDPYSLVLVGIHLQNGTNRAINELEFHVQLRDPKRTVPHGETVMRQAIPGGIEPGESRLIQLNVPSSELNLVRLSFNLQLPAGAQIYVAIVENEDYQLDKPYYEMYADLQHTVAPYTFVHREDPAIKALLGLEMP